MQFENTKEAIKYLQTRRYKATDFKSRNNRKLKSWLEIERIFNKKQRTHIGHRQFSIINKDAEGLINILSRASNQLYFNNR